MFTDNQLDEAEIRLEAGKLTGRDINSLVSAFRQLVTYLEIDNNYKFKEDLLVLDDEANPDERLAANMAAGLVILTAKQFKTGAIEGGKSGVKNSQMKQRAEVVKFLFGLLYPIPAELSDFNLTLVLNRLINQTGSGISQTVDAYFVP
jgi:hypothetical protein